MSKETGGTAFPWVESYVNVDKGERYENYGDAGMTLRDYFAAKAMQVLLNKESLIGYGVVSEQAYLVADRMIEARGQ